MRRAYKFCPHCGKELSRLTLENQETISCESCNYCTVWTVFLISTYAMAWVTGAVTHHFIDQIGQPILTIDGQLMEIEKPKNIPACYFHVRLDLDGYSVKATRYMGTSKFDFMHFDEREWVWVDYRIGRSGKVYLTDIRKIIE